MLNTPGERKLISQVYAQSKNVSIDYGVMEKADNVYVALGNFTWSDLGSWASLHEASVKDKENNVIIGEALVYDTRNSVIEGPPETLIVAQGLNGYLVGVFGNVVIICEKDKEDLFRRYVNDLKARPDGTNFL